MTYNQMTDESRKRIDWAENKVAQAKTVNLSLGQTEEEAQHNAEISCLDATNYAIAKMEKSENPTPLPPFQLPETIF